MTEINPRQNESFPGNGEQAHGYPEHPDLGCEPAVAFFTVTVHRVQVPLSTR